MDAATLTTIREVNERVKLAEDLVSNALRNRREALLRMRADGMKVREIAEVLGVTPQRVSKILDGNKKPEKKAAASE